MTTGTRAAGHGAALGFRPHSGWTALVAVDGPAAEPAAVLRRRVEPSGLTPGQPFHAAEGLPFDEASALAERAGKDALEERAALVAWLALSEAEAKRP
jgi:hypothetical protein